LVTTDKRDPPIEPQSFLGGVTVVDIGDIRVARGLTRRHHTSCRHARMTYDPKERRVWCPDCEKDVEPFDAFEILVSQFSAATRKLEAREKKLLEAEQFQIRSLAAKAIDEAWRSRNMVPACPHCNHGLFPEDFKRGVGTMLGRDYAKARINAKGKK
jgi:Zn finger protein HypA/HybF involved in hydrogenase expression